MLPLRILLSTNSGDTQFLRMIDESKASKHSKKIRDDLAIQRARSNTKPTLVMLRGSPGPMKYVLNVIDKCNNGRLYVKVHDGSLERAIVILEAVYELQIEPTQLHVENHIVGYISHTKLKPNEMISVHKAFGGAREVSRVWKVMIHQTAWNLINGIYTPHEASQLQEAATEYDELDEAIRAKFQELRRRHENYEEKKAKEERKTAVKQARQDEKKRNVEERRLERERKDQRWWDQGHGMCEASEEMVEYVLHYKPPVVGWEVKEKKQVRTADS